MSNLPPLTALRAFEATARLMSFTAAAYELNVTQSAVSRQVKILENYLARPLFERLTRRIELTTHGEAYYQEIYQAFQKITHANQIVMGQKSRTRLKIAVLPSLASLWLMPRLTSFWQANKHIDVQILTSTAPVDFASQRIDMAIQVGTLPGQGLRGLPLNNKMLLNRHGILADKLFRDIMVPVCHPDLLKNSSGNIFDNLIRYRLIHTNIRRDAWPLWLATQGVTMDPAQSNIEYGHYFMALQAASQAKGIALVPTVLVNCFDPENKILTRVGPALSSAAYYYLLTPERSYHDKAFEQFRSWLLTQTKG